jgi:hypothetical protein
MKNIFITILFFLLAIQVKAQGNLQFNQVLTLESAVNSCLVCWTVPSGKVWKIEGFSSNSNDPPSFYVNNKELGYLVGKTFTNTSTIYYGARWGVDFPIWLQANHTLGYAAIGTSRNITFFVLEFNIVP